MRFPGFEGEWKEFSIGKILKIGSGKDYKHLSNGDIPVFGTGGYMSSVNKYLFDGETVCIGRKGTINKPFYFNGKFWTVDTLFFTHSFQSVIPKFVFYVFEQINWLKYNEASGVPSLSKTTIEQILISIPNINEQKKIASILSTIDERIQTQNEIIENLNTQLKNLSYKIFSGKLRFKDEDRNNFPKWEKHKLNDVCNRVKIKNTIDNQNVLTISAQLGLVSQLEYFNKSVSAKNLTNYYLLTKNDFAYNKSYSNGYPMGAIKRLNNYDNGVVSTLYICFRFKKNISLDFIEHYFDSGLQNKELEKVAQEGARNHGLLNISLNDFFGIELIIPSQLEQKKIARFLTAITKKIKTEKQILEKYQNQKKYFLQNMFI